MATDRKISITDILGPVGAATVEQRTALVNALGITLSRAGLLVVVDEAPANDQGENGDVRLNIANRRLYTKTAGAWDDGVSWGEDGEDGTSVTLYRVSVMPAPEDRDPNGVYLLVSIDAPTVITTAGNVTYTAAQLLTGNICRDCNGAGRTDTLPTAALLVAALDSPAIGQSVECLIRNWSDAAETITLAVGLGGSWHASQVAATRVIPQFFQKVVKLRLTNVSAGTEAYTAYL